MCDLVSNNGVYCILMSCICQTLKLGWSSSKYSFHFSFYSYWLSLSFLRMYYGERVFFFIM